MTLIMELGNADVVCYKCDKRGHVMARCYTRVLAGAKKAQQEDALSKWWWQEPACETHEFCTDYRGVRKCEGAEDGMPY